MKPGINLSNAFYQHFVGFDRVLRDLETIANQTVDKYPPTDIVKISDESYQIVMAVAGFKREEIEIQLDDRKVVVSGVKAIPEGIEYVYKGISNRKFERTFTLNDLVHARGAKLMDGLLIIDLEVVKPEANKPKTLDIS